MFTLGHGAMQKSPSSTSCHSPTWSVRRALQGIITSWQAFSKWFIVMIAAEYACNTGSGSCCQTTAIQNRLAAALAFHCAKQTACEQVQKRNRLSESAEL